LKEPLIIKFKKIIVEFSKKYFERNPLVSLKRAELQAHNLELEPYLELHFYLIA
jgi:hypothetical protein